MKRYLILWILTVLWFSAGSLCGQTPSSPQGNPSNPLPDWVRINAQKRQEIERITNRDPSRNIIVGPRRGRRPPPDPDTEMSEEELAQLKAEAFKVNEEFQAPARYRTEYGRILELEDTGISRLFGDKGCGKGVVVTLAEMERCADAPPYRNGGSWMTFRCRPRVVDVRGYRLWVDEDCGTKYLKDLTFKDNVFMVGDGVVQGIIADIGDVDLESLASAHKALKFLSEYDPQQTIAKIAAQNEVLAKGITAKGFVFSNSVPVKLNSTYILRSVLYRYSEPGASKPRLGTDIRVAFKVVGIEPDGSVVLIWREMDRQHPRRQITQ